MLSHDPSRLPRSANLKFTEDSEPMRLGEGLWKSVSGIRPFRRDILDVPQGVAASKVVVEEGGSPVLLQIRLKIVDQEITEVETMTVRTQKEGALFSPDALKEPRKEMSFGHDTVCTVKGLDILESQISPRRPSLASQFFGSHSYLALRVILG